MTQDELTPNTAPLVATLLGADRAGAFDVGAACTAFLSAVAIARGADRERDGRRGCSSSAPTSSRGSSTGPTASRRRCSPTPPAPPCSARRSGDHGTIGPIVLGADGSQPRGDLRRALRPEAEDGRPGGLPQRRQPDDRGHARGGAPGRADARRTSTCSSTTRRTRGSPGPSASGWGCRPPASSTASSGSGTRPRRRSRWRCRRPSATAACEPGARVLLAAFGAGFTWGGGVIEWGSSGGE